jgi:hypothetical protein
MRIALTCQPRWLRNSSRRGWSWRSFAATEALAASKDQPSSSTGPGFTCGASATGSKACIAAKRALESCSRSRRLANGALRCKACAMASGSGTSGWDFDKGDFARTPGV